MILLLLYGPYILLSIVTIFCGRLFQLAGLGKGNVYKPLFNVYYWFRIARVRPILAILFFLPYINFLFIAILIWRIIRSYQTANGRIEAYNKSDASQVQWAGLSIDTILFILLMRGIINIFVGSIYAIPTSSMEKTFMTGDLVITERVSFGPRLPVTPFSLPFFHSRLPNSAKPSYLVKPQLPYYRFPGAAIHRYDVLIFNYPVQKQYPVDKRDYFMKRCMGLPGDTLSIKDGIVAVNGQLAFQPPLGQKTYIVRTDGTPLEMDIYMKYNITDGGKYSDEPGLYLLGLNKPTLDSLKALPYFKSAELSLKPKNLLEYQRFYYPADTSRYRWNSDQYGPLVIPSKGETVSLTREMLSFYEPLITQYEGNTLTINSDSSVSINGIKTDKYTFKMNYYFMMGDNRDNSEDSRFWGLVPEDHIDSKVIASFKPPAWMHKRGFGQ